MTFPKLPRPREAVVYKDIPGFPGYRAGSDGSVWSCWRVRGRGSGKGTVAVMSEFWKRQKSRLDSAGYVIVSVQTVRNGKRSSYPFLAHRLVLAAFVGPCPSGMVCCHADGNRSNNRPVNLRWGTIKENVHDEIKHGTFVRGSKNGRARMTEDQVREVKRLMSLGIRRKVVVAQVGITVPQYKAIQSGKGWRHVI